MPEILMNDLCVKEIRELVSAVPMIIKQNLPIDRIMEEFTKDPMTRHLYVVDNNDKLIGSIRLNNLIEAMFPHSSYGIRIDFKKKGFFYYQKTLIAMDVMKRPPLFITDSTPLPEMVELMVSHKVNELPVLDENHKIITEINFLEIINYYTHRKDSEVV